MKFIIVSEDTDYSPMFKVLFNDIFKYNKGIFISSPFNDKSKIKLFLFKVLYKKEINKYLNSKFEAIIRPKFKLLEEIENNKSKPTVVVFNNDLVIELDVSFYIFENQVLKSTYLEAKLYKNNEKK